MNIPDTVGYNLPHQFGELIRTLIERIPNSDRAVFSVHCHNDLGLAVANSLSAVMNGARQVECTINGLGERAGNASLEEIVMALRVRFDRRSRAYAARTRLLLKIRTRYTRLLIRAMRHPRKILGGALALFLLALVAACGASLWWAGRDAGPAPKGPEAGAGPSRPEPVALAVVGLLIIPAKRRRDKNDMHDKLEDLRQRLMKSMAERVSREGKQEVSERL